MKKFDVMGLTSQEAHEILKSDGYNELPTEGKRSPFSIVKGVIGEPMFALLITAAIIYLMIGNLQDALVLSGFAMISVAITIIQEWRSEKVLEALRDLTSPRALVIRDGQPLKIAGREVVCRDVIVLTEGERIPADAKLITPDIILTDESLLTGESMPVTKNADTANMIYAGTLVVRGSARAIVTATGLKSEIGKIGQALHSVEMEQPRLRQQTKKIVMVFALISGGLCGLVVLLYGLLHHDWLQGALSGLALAMAMLPEEFPLVLTVFMVMGAWRISKVHVLTRKASAIETLGSATVLCTDKTGTLTQNKMSIAYLKADEQEWAGNSAENIHPEIMHLLKSGAMASKLDSYDSMDIAFFENSLLKSEGLSTLKPDFHFGLQPNLLMMAEGYQQDDKSYNVFAKGAPETIAKACRLNTEQTQKILGDVENLAKKGLRILAVAEAKLAAGMAQPSSADQFEYRFLGIVGFADPLRENVPAAVAECRTAGIRIIMITGDFPVTAQSIAAQAGLDYKIFLTGDDVVKLDDAGLQASVKTTNIFARISPDQKLRIVQALKANGDVVAMTGDGVNDAPSLKAAHIGVAMGLRGTDVAREASSIVLLDDNFASLVHTIALGRRIYDNLRKAMVYIVAVHVPIAGLALLPLIFDKPLILTPLLIALMEMVIDPACSIVLEAEQAERNVMKRPPRSPLSPLLTSSALLWGVTQGGIALVILGAMWAIAHQNGMNEKEIRSLIFVSLIIINLSLILINRSFSASILKIFKHKNPILGWGTIGMTVLFGIIFFTPFSKTLFNLGDVHFQDVMFAVLAGIVSMVFLEGIKPFFRGKAFN
jgi:Ca2+-transporting ATPase